MRKRMLLEPLLVFIIVITMINFVNALPSTWWDTNWGAYKNITINNTRGTILYNMTILLNGSNGLDLTGLISASKLQSDCDDLRFIDTATNNTLLPYDWDINSTDSNFGCNSGHALIWIRLLNISTTGKIIKMYYRNPLATAGNKTNSTFQDMVLALTFSELAGNYIDKSNYGNNGTVSGSPVRQKSGCKYGYCLNLTAITDYVTITDSYSLDFPAKTTLNSSLTILAWAYTNNHTEDTYSRQIMTKATGTNDQDWWWIIETDTANVQNFAWGWPPGDHATSLTTNFSKWDFHAISEDGTTLKQFMDGTRTYNIAATKNLTNARNLVVGGQIDVLSMRQPSMIIDTIFIYNITKADNEIKWYYFDENNFSLGYEISSSEFTNINSMIYNSTTYETASSAFVLNITTNYSYPISSITSNFIYNGTSYSLSSSEITNSYSSGYTDDWIITKTIDLPIGVGTKSFKFEYVLTQENNSIISGNTSDYDQTINIINFSICDTDNNIKYLNFSYRNESTSLDYMSANVPSAVFNYWIGDGAYYKTYSYSSTVDKTNHSFCFYPSYFPLDLNVTYQYKTTGYVQRLFMNEFNSNNATTQKTLWLLSSDDGIYVTFQVVNTADQLLSDVSITINRTINNNPEIISKQYTDNSGISTFWLNPNNQYSLYFHKEGYDDYSTSIYPTQSSYTITLGGGGISPENYTTYYSGMQYWIYPRLSSLNNQTAYNFRFNLTSSEWDLDEFGFELINDSNTVLAKNSSTTSTGGTVYVNYNTHNQTRIIMNYYWIVDGNYTNGTFYWLVIRQYQGTWSLVNFFNDLKIFMNDDIFGGTNNANFTKSIIAFIIIFFIIGFLSYISGVYSPIALLIGITSLTWLAASPYIDLIVKINGLWWFIPAILTLITAAYGVYEFTR